MKSSITNTEKVKSLHYFLGSLCNLILLIISLIALKFYWTGGILKIKINFLIYALILVILSHQLFILFILPKIKDIIGLYKNITILLVTIIFSLFLFEIGSQVYYLFFPQKTLVNEYSQCDPVFDHSRIPNSSGVYSDFGGEFTTTYNINSNGFRDKEYNTSKCKDCYRIVMTGDSFTEGRGVNMEETFQNLLENRFNEISRDSKIEVINSGIDSNSVVLEYLWIKYKLLSMDPDLIILNFDISDPAQDSEYLKKGIFSENGELIAVDGCSGKENKPLWKNIKTVYLLNNVINKLIVVSDLNIERRDVPLEQDTLIITRYEYLESDIVNGYWNTSLLYLKKIVDLTRENRVDLVIVTYPWGHQISKDEWSRGRKVYGFEENMTYSLDPQQRIIKFCKLNNLTCFDMTKYFLKTDQKNYYKYDMHWTNEGHKLVARKLYDFLTDELLIFNQAQE